MLLGVECRITRFVHSYWQYLDIVFSEFGIFDSTEDQTLTVHFTAIMRISWIRLVQAPCVLVKVPLCQYLGDNGLGGQLEQAGLLVTEALASQHDSVLDELLPQLYHLDSLIPLISRLLIAFS